MDICGYSNLWEHGEFHLQVGSLKDSSLTCELCSIIYRCYILGLPGADRAELSDTLSFYNTSQGLSISLLSLGDNTGSDDFERKNTSEKQVALFCTKGK